MKFSIERTALLKTISHVQSVVERRNTIPILANVKIEAAGGQIKFTATDMDLEVVEAVDAEVADAGATTLPAKTLHDIVRRMADGAVVSVAVADDKAVIKSGRSRFTLPCLPVADFPLMAGGNLPHTFRIAAGEMKCLIDRTRFAISTEETRYYLNGIYLHERDGKLRAVATDGYRLASVEVPLPDGAAGMPGVIVPRKTVTEVRKLIDESAADVDVALSESMIRFACGSAVLTSKLIDGTFPNYQRVIPATWTSTITALRGDLINSVDRVATVSETPKARVVRLTAGEGTLTISSGDDNAGGLDEIDARFDGKPPEIAVNPRYLLDTLRSLDDGPVAIRLRGPMDPVLIDANPGAAFVMMPMRG